MGLMKLCILHIGSEKTGTSSIQKYFGQHRDVLVHEGIWYPKAFSRPPGHVHLQLSDAALDGSLSGDSPAGNSFAGEAAEAEKAGAVKAVISSEFFHSQLRDVGAIERLRAFLKPHFESFKIVYYARRQDQMLASMHSTAVRGNWTTDTNALSVYDSKGHYYFDHLAVCNLWASVFGGKALTCRVYERDKLKNGDIVDDFSTVIGLDLDKSRAKVDANESLSLETMTALLLLNRSRHKDNKEFRRKLIASGAKRKGRRVPMLTRADAKAFLAKFEVSNRDFFDRYVPSDLATGFGGDFSSFQEVLPVLSAQEVLDFVFSAKG
jgi:hypothetical protein